MSSFLLRPVSAIWAEKSSATQLLETDISEGRSPFRGHGGALKSPETA
jgi:hypothetical protein